MENNKQIKNIVVLGAGFGGLRAARLLGKGVKKLGLSGAYRVILIDRNPYQTYTPTLYEAATTSKTTANYLDLKSIVTLPVDGLIKGSGAEFMEDEVKSVDLVGGDIHCAKNNLKFDYLVLAIGSVTNYFNIPGLEQHSMTLKTFMDAIKLRDKILDLYESGKEEIRVVIGGGGSTGVELA